MYGKDFHEWQTAQRIIAEIKDAGPEVEATIREHYTPPPSLIEQLQDLRRKRSHVAYNPMPSPAEFERQRLRGPNDFNGFGIFGGIFV